MDFVFQAIDPTQPEDVYYLINNNNNIHKINYFQMREFFLNFIGFKMR